ncbi:MAG: sensor histidine kinase [Chloroflexi bacterium]|nr:MAG: sensor histidine kinase [Chloroflexota bacterium]
MLEYIRELTSHLLRSLRTQQQTGFGINLKIHGDPILLNVNDLVPAGLIINELVTNALKYAFPNGRTGEIEVVASAGPDGGWQLTVSDNGVGFPGDVDFHNTTSLGLQLVNVLVSQLDGRVTLDGSNGTRVVMQFPAQTRFPI